MQELSNELIRIMLTSPIYWTIIILGVLFLILYRKIMGFMGEFWVNLSLKRLRRKDYKILNDVMIEVNDMTHQIDHIIVSKYGIFVLETKNYSGNIYGKEFDEKWTQYLGGKKFYFHNPIRQNYGHVQALKEVLKISNEKFFSIVVFSNRAKLKISSKTPVVNFDYLIKTIKNYKEILLNDNEVEYIANVISKSNIIDNKRRKAHIKNIKSKLKN